VTAFDLGKPGDRKAGTSMISKSQEEVEVS
jgi:hypothetical protein